MLWTVRSVAATVAVAGTIAAVSLVAIGPSSPFAGKFLMAFHACDRGASHGCEGPECNHLYLAQSDDGWGWSLVPGIEPFEGDVPDIIRRGDTIYVYYLTFGLGDPPEVLRVRRYDATTGMLEKTARVSVKHSIGAKEQIVDPSLVVDDDGRLVMFYLVQDVGMNDPAVCLPGCSSCVKTFRSATELEGSDGTKFVVDEGNRYEREIGSHEILADPDVFETPEGYVMYLGYVDESYRGGAPDVTLALFSETLRGSYELVPALDDGVLVRSISGGPSGVYDFETRQYWSYGTQVSRDRSLIIAGAAHTTLDTLIPESGLRPAVTGEGLAGLGHDFMLASPGLALNLP